jgi:aspartate 1-decarboxylase
MLRTMCKGKIHRARVTEARLDYTGSITIDERLMLASDIRPYELVHVNSMANAVHWETYAIPGKPGQICLNGCPARLFQPGDESSSSRSANSTNPNWGNSLTKSSSSTRTTPSHRSTATLSHAERSHVGYGLR